MIVRSLALQSRVQANPSVAESPEIAATQTKLPSRLNTDAAAPGVAAADVCSGADPEAELVAEGLDTVPVLERV